MDISSIAQEVQASYAVQVARTNLKERIQNLLQLPWNGGLFKITPELIMFVNLQFVEGKTNKSQQKFILPDAFENPILIEDIEQFYISLRERYYEVMNEYYTEYNRLKNIRTITDLNI